MLAVVLMVPPAGLVVDLLQLVELHQLVVVELHQLVVVDLRQLAGFSWGYGWRAFSWRGELQPPPPRRMWNLLQLLQQHQQEQQELALPVLLQPCLVVGVLH